jgi:hypothetical protein
VTTKGNFCSSADECFQCWIQNSVK